MDMSNIPPTGRTNVPLYSFGVIALFITAFVILVVTGHANDSGAFTALAISTIPSLIAALFAERASRDIRNGVVEYKAQQGAKQAIEDAQVLTRTGPVVEGQLAALHALVSDIHARQGQSVERNSNDDRG